MSLVTTLIAVVMFLWVSYNMPPVIVGFRKWNAVMKQHEKDNEAADPPDPPAANFQPKVSIIVPVKNEAEVVDRLLKRLVNLSYGNKEIILVEDGSTDNSFRICVQWAEKYPDLVKCYHNDESSGKPMAISSAARKATGEVVAVYDADTMVESDILDRIVPHFNDPNVAAVQGELKTLNPDENAITRLSVINDFIVNLQQLGRDRLDLFIPLLGTNQYVRRSVLEKLGYWDSNALSEDTEISVRLMRKGYKTKYVAVDAMVEAPAKLKVFLKQRMKWLRGYTQALAKHKGMLRDPNRHTFDACLTLIFPIMLVLGLVGYVGALYGVFQKPENIPILQVIGVGLVIFNLLIPTLLVSSNPRNAIYVPLIYLDWILLAAVSLYVHMLALLGKTQKWTRTPKTGHVTIPVSRTDR
jgi:cellulose synthase/poly-beta-1,6-N-acetylglucosamine synthase-like glycosyltransferase